MSGEHKWAVSECGCHVLSLFEAGEGGPIRVVHCPQHAAGPEAVRLLELYREFRSLNHGLVDRVLSKAGVK